MDTAELSHLVFDALGVATSTLAFEQELAARGVQIEWSRRGEELVGLKVRPVGSSTWLKGSSVNRELSAAKVLTALARNAPANSPAPAQQQPLAAPAPVAVADALSFLDTEATQPTGAAIDLPQQAGNGSQTAHEPFDEPFDPERAARAERERAETALDDELRELEIGELFDLANPRIEPVELSAARLAALVLLALKLLSFGLFRPTNPLADRLAARAAIAPRAQAEIQRRKLTPSGVQRRRALLDEETQALERRRAALATRSRAIAMSSALGPRPLGPVDLAYSAQLSVERKHDTEALAAAPPRPTFASRRVALAKVEEQIAAREGEAVAEGQDRVGFFGLALGGRTGRARRTAAQQQRARELQRLQAQRQALLLAIARMLDAIQARIEARVAAAEAAAEAQRALQLEAATVEAALRERLPAERRELALLEQKAARELVQARAAGEAGYKAQDRPEPGAESDGAPPRPRHRG